MPENEDSLLLIKDLLDAVEAMEKSSKRADSYLSRSTNFILMNTKPVQGVFAVIDSFAIKSRNEFYLIGELTEGKIESMWFVNVPLNKSLSITVRIKSIENVDFTHEKGRYKLIIVDSDSESTELLLGLNIGSETVNITIDGED